MSPLLAPPAGTFDNPLKCLQGAQDAHLAGMRMLRSFSMPTFSSQLSF
jgi:hypothetical protein